MIYTQYNTQKEKKLLLLPTKHLEQTAIAAPIDKLISSNIVPTLKQIILIAASKRLSKTFLEFYKFYVCRGDLEPAGQTTLI
jgi:hypothetical protein